MMRLAVEIELANVVTVERLATRIRASIAACHSARSCSAFGSFVMNSAASSRVMSGRPRGNGIGSSKGRFQPQWPRASAHRMHKFISSEAVQIVVCRKPN